MRLRPLRGRFGPNVTNGTHGTRVCGIVYPVKNDLDHNRAGSFGVPPILMPEGRKESGTAFSSLRCDNKETGCGPPPQGRKKGGNT